ncbi:MAG: hypothetical protein ABW140_10710 [Candidatus Sedimenticola sp. 6PFRAG1]
MSERDLHPALLDLARLVAEVAVDEFMDKKKPADNEQAKGNDDANNTTDADRCS